MEKKNTSSNITLNKKRNQFFKMDIKISIGRVLFTYIIQSLFVFINRVMALPVCDRLSLVAYFLATSTSLLRKC